MKYIKLFEDFNQPDKTYYLRKPGSKSYQLDIFLDDLNHLCSILPLKYEQITSDPIEIVIENLRDFYSKPVEGASISSKLHLIIKYSSLYDTYISSYNKISIRSYSCLVRNILTYFNFTNEQWLNIINVHPEFYQFLKDGRLYHHIPSVVLDKLPYLKNELF